MIDYQHARLPDKPLRMSSCARRLWHEAAKIFQMAAEGKRSRSRPEKGYFKTLEDGVHLKSERVHPKSQKVDTETMYPIEIIERDETTNRVKIHFIGFSHEHDEWRDGDQSLTNTEKLSLGRYVPRYIPSDQSLEDRAGAMFLPPHKGNKNSVFFRANMNLLTSG
ncbi:hypothetical protein OS493_018548 [Desmophyllum pertusum]|uniref:Chromo domain-containing protein n=1 Tax=Desmophyllum pertusum TaxID=174260 RepID=A0A9X0DB20_9CNID|nr:hypothetical protein OS493_018548 [Desmophyllum pertusum]